MSAANSQSLQDPRPFSVADHLAEPIPEPRTPSTSLAPLVIAAVIALLHLLTDSRYGFHRDELQFLSDGRHLDWGFVVYPPLTPFLAHIAFAVFGASLLGFRLFAILAQFAATVITGRMARDLGGRRLAQGTAALAVALTPISIHFGTELIYSSFDYLWWIVTAWLVIRLIKSQNPRWWLGLGSVLGLGLMTKYTIGVFIAGIVAALIFTPLRVYLRSRWLWMGVALTFLIVSPNIVWQLRHHLISLHWMHSIHLRDLGMGRDKHFILLQFLICANFIATPLWIAGLFACLRSDRFRPYRPLAWMYLTPLVLLMLMKARDYYLAPTYPMLLAVGAVVAESWLASVRPTRQRILKGTFFTLIFLYALLCIVQVVPVFPSGKLRAFTLAHSIDLRDEIGWPELIQTIAAVRDTLPAASQSGAAILVGNYGEAGAVELYGPAYHLPPLITGTNSGWIRGYPSFQPSTLIVVGLTRTTADGWFPNCRAAAQVTNSLGIANPETDPVRSTILICGPPRLPWPIFWQQFHSFG